MKSIGGGKIVIKIIDQKIWDKFVDNNRSGYLFHKWDLLKIVEKYSGYHLYPYGFFDNEELIGILPLYFKQYYFIKLLFSPPPQSAIPHMGIILSDNFYKLKEGKKEAHLNMIIEGLENEIKKIHPNYISISFTTDFLDIRNFKWEGYDISLGYTYVLDLSNSLDFIWNNFSKSCKDKIKTLSNLSIDTEESNDFLIIYDRLKERYIEQNMNLPIYGAKYISDLKSKFPEKIKYYIFKNKNVYLASQVIIKYKEIYSLLIGAVKSNKNIDVNEYVIWYLIRDAKNSGLKTFDFLGAGEKNISRFKNKFNPNLSLSFKVKKTDLLGKFAELFYLNILKKRSF